MPAVSPGREPSVLPVLPSAAPLLPDSLSGSERARRRKRGVVLATFGLLLALAVLAALRLLGFTAFSWNEWGMALAATLVVQTSAFIGVDPFLASRWRARPYGYVPTLAVIALVGLYVWLAPEVRLLTLMIWPVSLLFLAGTVGAAGTALLGLTMAGSYLAAVALRGAGTGWTPNPAFEGAVVGVFVVVQLFSAVVFERLRRQRRQMRELRAALADLALTDPLTGLPNRRHFEQALRVELERVRRSGAPCSLALLDLDHFKNYNDTLGHPAGDEALREAAAVMQAHARAGDVLFRVGGEEFALILAGTGRDAAWAAVERVRRVVEAHAFPGQEVQPQGCFTLSAGIATAPDDAVVWEELVVLADRALYRAKRDGRNRVCGARAA